jgi:hypothetical protein
MISTSTPDFFLLHPDATPQTGSSIMISIGTPDFFLLYPGASPPMGSIQPGGSSKEAPARMSTKMQLLRGVMIYSNY